MALTGRGTIRAVVVPLVCAAKVGCVGLLPTTLRRIEVKKASVSLLAQELVVIYPANVLYLDLGCSST